MKFGEENGAEYYDDEEEALIFSNGKWVKYGSNYYKTGLAIHYDGTFQIGDIRKSCMNFEETSSTHREPHEHANVIELMKIVAKFNKGVKYKSTSYRKE